MMAFCGLICDSCPILLATRETDESMKRSMRESVAEICSRQYGMNLSADDINDCDGCKGTTGQIFRSCLDCKIRQCAQQKKLENCAYCNKYSCEKLNPIFADDPGARDRLDSILHSSKLA
ncbi:MAG TPA: DUF3795 domain-containing protein [Sunxiuqinia sp.]|nr:DUF3795 domain-containing protein [Sunxiuqinia sp.]